MGLYNECLTSYRAVICVRLNSYTV